MIFHEIGTNLASAYVSQGKHAEAIDAYRRVLMIAPLSTVAASVAPRNRKFFGKRRTNQPAIDDHCQWRSPGRTRACSRRPSATSRSRRPTRRARRRTAAS